MENVTLSLPVLIRRRAALYFLAPRFKFAESHFLRTWIVDALILAVVNFGKVTNS